MREQKLIYLKSLTAMIVDDNSELLRDLRDILSIFFKEVVLAESGEEALKLYSNGSIDAVFTDYVMPEMDGFQLCSNIRKCNQRIPLIIMSNYYDSKKLLKAIPLNLVDYLIKPIDYTTLTDTLIKIVEKLENESYLFQKIGDDIIYNFRSCELKIDNELINLSKSEQAIFEILLKNMDRFVSIEELSLSIGRGGEIKSEQAIKNSIHRLRGKLLNRDIIKSLKGYGYSINKSS